MESVHDQTSKGCATEKTYRSHSAMRDEATQQMDTVYVLGNFLPDEIFANFANDVMFVIRKHSPFVDVSCT